MLSEVSFEDLLRALAVSHERELNTLRSKNSSLRAETWIPHESDKARDTQEHSEARHQPLQPELVDQIQEADIVAEAARETQFADEVEVSSALSPGDNESNPEVPPMQVVASAHRLWATEYHTQETLPEDSETLHQRVERFLQSATFEGIIIGLVCLSIALMAMQFQVEGVVLGQELGFYSSGIISQAVADDMGYALLQLDRVFLVLFALDVGVRIVVLRWKFWQAWLNWMDFFAVVLTLLAVVFGTIIANLEVDLPVKPVHLRLLRLGKLCRALHIITASKALHSLQLLLKCLSSSAAMLFWSFVLLVGFQCVAGMLMNNLAKTYMETPDNDLDVRIELFKFYGTFSRVFLTTFEIMFANWSPACRILLDHVSEYFSLFFLVYRCVFGFAVLNVVNAVFVQQTLGVANEDESLAMQHKAKEQKKTLKLIEKVFSKLDTSHDGYLSHSEFESLVQLPKLKLWMSQLELDYHDVFGLFELLDDGDGKISLAEFANAVTRMQGQAKSLDIWRLENKTEALLSKVLMSLTNSSRSDKNGFSVANVLKEAGLKHQVSLYDMRATR